MRKLVVICLMILFCLCGCENQPTERTDVKINLPKDDTVNGYRLEKEEMPDTISKIEVSVSENNNNNTVSAELCGNKNSKIYHKSSCSSAKKMLDSNKVYYKTTSEFEENGYKACKKCNP